MNKLKNDIILIDIDDNVGTAIRKLNNGEKVISISPDGKKQKITILENIPAYHKISMKDIKKNDKIIKYGFSIGKSIIDIKKGMHVHIHNIVTNQDNNE